MTHKKIVYQTETESGSQGLAKLCFVLAAFLVILSVIVAEDAKSYRYSSIEWILRYFDLYMWFYVGAGLFVAVGNALYRKKGGLLTVTDIYVSLETPNNMIVLPIDQITSIRKDANNLLVVTTAAGTLQLAKATDSQNIIDAILSQKEQSAE